MLHDEPVHARALPQGCGGRQYAGNPEDAPRVDEIGEVDQGREQRAYDEAKLHG